MTRRPSGVSTAVGLAHGGRPGNTRRPAAHGPAAGRLLSAAMVLLAAVAAYLLVSSPWLAVRDVVVTGNRLVATATVEQLAGIRPGENIFAVSASAVARQVESDPLVAKVRVYRRLPHTMVIVVQERQPAVLLPYHGDFLLADAHGRVLAVVANPAGFGVPVLTGVAIPPLAVGQVVATAAVGWAAEFMAGLPPNLAADIGEFAAGDPTHLVAYTQAGLPVRLGGPAQLGQKAAALASVWADLVARGETAAAVDVSDPLAPVVTLAGTSH